MRNACLNSVPQEYLCLWESRTMPGVIQLGRTAAQPDESDWILQSPAGQTRFRVTHYIQSGSGEAIESRMRAALESDRVNGYEDFFFTSPRFAIQMLEDEARQSGRTLQTPGPRRHLAHWKVAATWVCLPVLGMAVFTGLSHQKVVKKPAYRMTRLTVR